MSTETQATYLVAVIGAGPAGIYGAHKLATEGVHVLLLNRDIKPGGLAEYGIYPDKHKMKSGLRKVFRRLLAHPNIEYYGNIIVSRDGDITLDDLRRMGVQALLVTVGAQGIKSLGLPGEDLKGVYHAKEIVYHYNKLPPYSTWSFDIGERVALIGVGNVMVDVARWLIRERKVKEVVAVARRGPAEVKFTRDEFETIAANLDLDAFEAEMARVAPVMRQVGQDPEEAKAFILSAREHALPPVSDTRFYFRFLASPKRILGDDTGHVRGLEVENTTLVPRNGGTKAQGLGTTDVLDVDTVIFCIGDQVDPNLGLPTRWGAYITNPNPRFPVDGESYEAYDPETERPIEGVFVAGWARRPSTGLVGTARKDGTNGALALLQYLHTVEPLTAEELIRRLEQVRAHLQGLGKPIVTKEDWLLLERVEEEEAKRRGLPEFKFATNEEMLAAIARAREGALAEPMPA